MAKCHQCGEEIPQTEVLKHYNTKHPERRQKSKVAKENEQPKVATTTIENVSKAPPEKPLEAIAEQKTEAPPAQVTKPAPAPEPPATKPEPEAEQPEVKPPGVPETEEMPKAEITTVRTTGVFTYEVTLPADAFTLFNLAKACGLEPNDGKLFDEWLWDCVRARFRKDYKKQLILAPLEE